MIQVQDDPTTPVLNNAVSASTQSVSTEETTKKEASIDELLAQLETLNQEIARKSVPATAEPAELEPPTTVPALEESKDVALPSPQEDSKDEFQLESKTDNDFDLDAFIKDLEEKIAQQNSTQESAPTQSSETAAEPNMEENKAELVDEEAFFRKLRQKADLAETDDAELSPEEPAKTEEAVAAESQSAATKTTDNPDLDQLIADLEKSLKEYEASHQEAKPVIDSKPSATEPEPGETAPVEPASLTLNNGQLNEEPVKEAANTEGLEAQNIFDMLNLSQLSDQEKDSFLNDLEKLIWDNFITIDLPLLLTAEEKAEADRLMSEVGKSEDEQKEALLVYLDKLVPNLEQVMYQKAITLKKELFEERLRKMREQAKADNNLSLLADLDQIDDLLKAERYQTAVQLLNKS